MLSDLSPEQYELALHMSEISERAYCAGWMEGLEFVLWQELDGKPFRYGQLDVTDEHLARLRDLSRACGGWIYFHEDQQQSFVSLAEWKVLVARATERK